MTPGFKCVSLWLVSYTYPRNILLPQETLTLIHLRAFAHAAPAACSVPLPAFPCVTDSCFSFRSLWSVPPPGSLPRTHPPCLGQGEPPCQHPWCLCSLAILLIMLCCYCLLTCLFPSEADNCVWPTEILPAPSMDPGTWCGPRPICHMLLWI